MAPAHGAARVRTENNHRAGDERSIPWSSIRRALRIEQERELEQARRSASIPPASVHEVLDHQLASATAVVDMQILIGFVEQLEQGGGIPVSVGG